MQTTRGSLALGARSRYALRARGKVLELGERTAVMGIVNVTPDSFYRASCYGDPDQAIAAAIEMIQAGADIIDVGGESTRPGSRPVPPDEELRRVLPVVSEIRRQTDVLISIDTRKAGVAEKAIAAGADIINDVSGLTSDPRSADLAARAGAGMVLMHMKGTPETMQLNPTYDDVIEEVKATLARAIRRAEDSGVAPDSIIVDPGIGFGKTTEHNLQIINRLHHLSSLDRPLLVGTSRKSFIGRVLDAPPEERLLGTAATVAAAILHGAHVVRVHDVREMVRVARVVDAVLMERLVGDSSADRQVGEWPVEPRGARK